MKNVDGKRSVNVSFSIFPMPGICYYVIEFVGDPDRIRTCDHRLRRPKANRAFEPFSPFGLQLSSLIGLSNS